MKIVGIVLGGLFSSMVQAQTPLPFHQIEQKMFASVASYFAETVGEGTELRENDVWAYDLVEFKIDEGQVKGFVVSSYANGWAQQVETRVRHACWTRFVEQAHSWKAIQTECVQVF